MYESYKYNSWRKRIPKSVLCGHWLSPKKYLCTPSTPHAGRAHGECPPPPPPTPIRRSRTTTPSARPSPVRRPPSRRPSRRSSWRVMASSRGECRERVATWNSPLRRSHVIVTTVVAAPVRRRRPSVARPRPPCRGSWPPRVSKKSS